MARKSNEGEVFMVDRWFNDLQAEGITIDAAGARSKEEAKAIIGRLQWAGLDYARRNDLIPEDNHFKRLSAFAERLYAGDASLSHVARVLLLTFRSSFKDSLRDISPESIAERLVDNNKRKIHAPNVLRQVSEVWRNFAFSGPEIKTADHSLSRVMSATRLAQESDWTSWTCLPVLHNSRHAFEIRLQNGRVERFEAMRKVRKTIKEWETLEPAPGSAIPLAPGKGSNRMTVGDLECWNSDTDITPKTDLNHIFWACPRSDIEQLTAPRPDKATISRNALGLGYGNGTVLYQINYPHNWSKANVYRPHVGSAGGFEGFSAWSDDPDGWGKTAQLFTGNLGVREGVHRSAPLTESHEIVYLGEVNGHRDSDIIFNHEVIAKRLGTTTLVPNQGAYN